MLLDRSTLRWEEFVVGETIRDVRYKEELVPWESEEPARYALRRRARSFDNANSNSSCSAFSVELVSV